MADDMLVQAVIDALVADGLPASLSVGGHKIEQVAIKADDQCHWEFGRAIMDAWYGTLFDGFENDVETVDLEIDGNSVDVAAIVAGIKGAIAAHQEAMRPDPMPVVEYDEDRVRAYVKGYRFLEAELERLGSLRAVYEAHIVTDRWRSNEYNKV
jgi:hypothetical protein